MKIKIKKFFYFDERYLTLYFQYFNIKINNKILHKLSLNCVWSLHVIQNEFSLISLADSFYYLARV